MMTDPAVVVRRLIDALAGEGIEIRTAFRVKPTDEDKWYLYLAIPGVDENGKTSSYGIIHRVIRQMPELWLDPFEVKVIGMTDTLTSAATELAKSKVAAGSHSMPNFNTYPGVTFFGGSTFGGMSVDGVYIYPMTKSTVSV